MMVTIVLTAFVIEVLGLFVAIVPEPTIRKTMLRNFLETNLNMNTKESGLSKI
jgi:hypothetical protein